MLTGARQRVGVVVPWGEVLHMSVATPEHDVQSFGECARPFQQRYRSRQEQDVSEQRARRRRAVLRCLLPGTHVVISGGEYDDDDTVVMAPRSGSTARMRPAGIAGATWCSPSWAGLKELSLITAVAQAVLDAQPCNAREAVQMVPGYRKRRPGGAFYAPGKEQLAHEIAATIEEHQRRYPEVMWDDAWAALEDVAARLRAQTQ